MKIFLHTSNGTAIADELDPSATVGDLIAQTGLSDATAWSQDADEPLNASDLASTIGDNGHVHINRCRHITVTVNYNGRAKEDTFAPGATIQAVRQWAVGPRGFDLPVKERPKHEVGVCGTGVIAERDEHVGTLATDCGLCLDLAPKDRFQG